MKRDYFHVAGWDKSDWSGRCWLAIGDPGEAQHIEELRGELREAGDERRAEIAEHLAVCHGIGAVGRESERGGE